MNYGTHRCPQVPEKDLPDLAAVGGRGTLCIGLPGRAAMELGAGLPPSLPSVSDYSLSECSTGGLEIRAASLRGLLHRYRKQPRQDDFSVVHDPVSGITLIVVCDGVGSLPRSEQAAAFVTGRLSTYYLDERDWIRAVRKVNTELQDFAQAARQRLGSENDPAETGMATTVVAVAIESGPAGHVAHLVWSDDSTGWTLSVDGDWACLTAQPDDADGEIHTGSVRALPAPTPRLKVTTVPLDKGCLFIMTDGVGFPLATSSDVRDTLARWWIAPPDIFTFGRQVGFARQSHMDDRTVVGVWVTNPGNAGPSESNPSRETSVRETNPRVAAVDLNPTGLPATMSDPRGPDPHRSWPARDTTAQE